MGSLDELFARCHKTYDLVFVRFPHTLALRARASGQNRNTDGRLLVADYCVPLVVPLGRPPFLFFIVSSETRMVWHYWN